MYLVLINIQNVIWILGAMNCWITGLCIWLNVYIKEKRNKIAWLDMIKNIEVKFVKVVLVVSNKKCIRWYFLYCWKVFGMFNDLLINCLSWVISIIFLLKITVKIQFLIWREGVLREYWRRWWKLYKLDKLESNKKEGDERRVNWRRWKQRWNLEEEKKKRQQVKRKKEQREHKKKKKKNEKF